MAKKKSAKQEFFDVLKSVGELEYLGSYYRQQYEHGCCWRHRATVKYKGHDTLFEVMYKPQEYPSTRFQAVRHDREIDHAGSRPYYQSVGGHDFNQRFCGNSDDFVKWVRDVWDSTSMCVRPDGIFGSYSSICMHDDNLVDEKLQKKLAAQKPYTVELHYDASIKVTVKASDDKEAIQKAIKEAVYASAQRFQFGKRTSEQIINQPKG